MECVALTYFSPGHYPNNSSEMPGVKENQAGEAQANIVLP